jgi:hypothetical protein
MSPRVGFIVDVPQSAEGMRREPAVSLPVAAGTVRAASAAADPPLDPPAVRVVSHGLPTWSVEPPAAHSCVCRWPSRTIPASPSRSQTVLSVSGTRSQARLEPVSGRPATA